MVARLHDEGFRVMPYINGGLWDTRDRGAEDYLFTDSPGRRDQERKGEVFTGTYLSKATARRSARRYVPFDRSMGSQGYGGAFRIFYRLNTDAVYVDQIASASRNLAATLHHIRAGGGWWPEADRLLARTARTLPPDKAISTESTAEPYISHIAAFLSWDCVGCGGFPPGLRFIGANLGRAYYSANDCCFRIDG